VERDIIILLLRLGLLAILYVFLFELFVILWRDLRPPTTSLRPEQPDVPWLEILEPAASGRTVGEQIPLQPMTGIGRGEANSIVLADPSVSAEHALISQRLGHWWIEDLDSTNGTFINDVRIDQPTVLGSGDIVRLGTVRLRVHI